MTPQGYVDSRALGLSADSTAWYLRWHRALALGDSARQAFWADSERLDPLAVGQIGGFIAWSGFGAQDWLRAVRMARRIESGQPGEITSIHATALLNGGRPREAHRLLQPDDTSADGLGARLQHALWWEGDTSGTETTARLLTSRADGSLRYGAAGVEQQTALCTVAMWHAARGEFEAIPERIGGTMPAGISSNDSIARRQYATLCAALLDALRASALHRPDARAKLAEADQAARAYILVRTVPANLIVARVAEAEGDLALALRAVRRRDGDLIGFQWYLSTFLREEGRLAALTGDTAGAIRAYQHYMMFHSDPEPEMKPEVERVRLDLAKLVQEPSRSSPAEPR